jgi:hypothetical protein
MKYATFSVIYAILYKVLYFLIFLSVVVWVFFETSDTSLLIDDKGIQDVTIRHNIVSRDLSQRNKIYELNIFKRQ